MEKEIIDFIVKEVRPRYDENIEEAAKVFLDTLKYDIDEDDLNGLGTRLIPTLDALATESQPLHTLFPAINKVEPYARKVLCIVNRVKYNSIKEEQGGFSPILSALGIRAKQIQRAYDLRNLEAHACKDWTRGQSYEKILDILIACLKITNEQIGQLKKVIYQSGGSKENTFEYINAVIRQYKDKINKIVQLDSEEDVSLLDINAVENDTGEKVARKGSVRELIASIEEKRMILWGDAGAGKTTTLEYIVYLDAKDYKAGKSSKIPVLIYLGMATDEHLTLEDYIADKLNIKLDELKALLKNGRINLYFDGYNEIPYTERNMLKTKRRRELTNILENYPDTFIILTNRPQDGKEFSRIPVFNLLEMDNGKVEEFIQKNTASEGEKNKVREAIDQDENLFQLIKKPLILKSLLFIVKTTGAVPRREGRIIGDFLKALFVREQQEKYDEYLDEERIHLLLRRIGYETFENNKTNSGISKEIIMDIMNRCQKDYNFSYDNLYALNLIVHLGIMDKRDNQYVFAHQSYQDYYAAQEEKAVLDM
ncbi:NACHT domain-containing protein [Anaerovibrio lipolyticus]|uniref:NACHT domain-containing protein n=1 Tax=Anaerovibrio lipolyticus TaxID=82374 RepID=UPI000484DEF0|nr:NACHT domain-containing protein [Anaerovibrio lipolyticus]